RAKTGDEVGVLLDEHDLVAGVTEVSGDVHAHIARAGDGDLHACLPSSARRESSSSRDSRRTAMYRRSPSWPTSSGLASRASPPRVRPTSRYRTPWHGSGSLR